MASVEGGNPRGAEVIKLNNAPSKVEELKSMVNAPQDIDGATNELGIPAELLNVGLATAANLEFLNIGLKNAVYIPRQVSEREGGRKSLYFLCKGETAMAGIYTAESGILKRYVTRLSGTTKPAQTGDLYMEELKTVDGRLIYQGTGTLNILDEKLGIGQITLAQTNTRQYAVGAKDDVMVWVLWSCIKVVVNS